MKKVFIGAAAILGLFLSFWPTAWAKTPLTPATCRDETCVDASPAYVIITRPMFLKTIGKFVSWKEENGFRTGILTVEYIVARYDGANPAEKMRNAIKDFSKKGAKYFLLIGDTVATDKNGTLDVDRIYEILDVNRMYDLKLPWNVPSGYYCRTDLYDENPDRARCIETTDLYFADFDDEAWQKDSDGYIMRGIYSNEYRWNGTQGPPFVKITPNPDLPRDRAMLSHDARLFDFETIVARIPIRTAGSFGSIFKKMRQFKPVSSLTYLEEAFPIDPETSFKDFCLRADLRAAGVSVETMALRSIGCAQNSHAWRTLFEKANRAYSETVFHLPGETEKAKQAFRASNDVVSFTFHGMPTAMSVMASNEVRSFKKIFPALMPISCMIGAFALYDQDSLTEKLIKAPRGPAFIISPTNNYAFFKASLEGKTVGEAFYNIGEEVIRYTAVSNNLFGDPSLKIFRPL